MDYKLTSVGIDIGTTTTQLVISELHLQNRLPGARIPSIEIIDKKILYESEIYFTPVIDHKTVDAPAIKEIIDKEYAKAGIRLEDIDTGAIIITGETAKKENASRIIHELSAYAGDFVVAVAGPALESILAGKGSGAAEISRKRREVVANLDVGGGTTNIAVFDNGNLIDAACINIGGRLIEVDRISCEVMYIAEPARKIIDYFEIPVRVGEKVPEQHLESVVRHMAGILDEVIGREGLSRISRELLMTSPLKSGYSIDSVMFSGGVARYIYDDVSLRGRYFNIFLHGDTGPVLAGAIKNCGIISRHKLLEPVHTIRATVVGAGVQSINISGSTTFLNKGLLPMKNISIGRIVWGKFPGSSGEIADMVRDVLDRFSFSSGIHPVALSVPQPGVLSFENVEQLAKGICLGWESSRFNNSTLVIILEKDFAKALGQTICRLTAGMKKFICIDLISVEDGDYIDIGKAIPGEDVVPVVIKTLVFSNN